MLRDERLQKVVAEIDGAPDRERVRGSRRPAGLRRLAVASAAGLGVQQCWGSTQRACAPHAHRLSFTVCA